MAFNPQPANHSRVWEPLNLPCPAWCIAANLNYITMELCVAIAILDMRHRMRTPVKKLLSPISRISVLCPASHSYLLWTLRSWAGSMRSVTLAAITVL
jgi:hypothetical protein